MDISKRKVKFIRLHQSHINITGRGTVSRFDTKPGSPDYAEIRITDAENFLVREPNGREFFLSSVNVEHAEFYPVEEPAKADKK